MCASLLNDLATYSLLPTLLSQSEIVAQRLQSKLGSVRLSNSEQRSGCNQLCTRGAEFGQQPLCLHLTWTMGMFAAFGQQPIGRRNVVLLLQISSTLAVW